ncbi:YidC/Oxa1 family membrane protein insertase [Streptomyces beijiangensis]|uniref:Membrane protein insertase YidC n=1 Tax=Streptomyces beijiangensis TaxID=163361 RepID=A0A939FBN8_9ACTN|nr:YidC/Oxa1 family membrane protein insertase [Streptomyces beijiangensis]MBO0516306.1 YidC/Oxa1 family membrane protein insertase [Streptomyces beijiangensis]
MSAFMSVFASLVAHLADLLDPLFAGASMAAAIILFTACVRLAIHPLSRSSARAQKSRAALAPQIAELRKKHGKDAQKLQKATMELYAAEKVSPLAGCLPALLQMPAFFLMYHLFESSSIGGKANVLLQHSLMGSPLGGRWRDALGHGGLFGSEAVVYLVLFAIVAAVATFNYGRTKRMMATSAAAAPTPVSSDVPGAGAMSAMTKVMPLMSFMTLFTVGFVPLAAALYVVTSTTWSAVERAYLYRDVVPSAAVLATPM